MGWVDYKKEYFKKIKSTLVPINCYRICNFNINFFKNHLKKRDINMMIFKKTVIKIHINKTFNVKMQ